LGPLLFLLFIIDLPDRISELFAEICLYCDDTEVSLKAKTIQDLEARVFGECEKIIQWFVDNKLIINSTKTKVMNFSISNSKENSQSSYLIGNNVIDVCDSTKFLGIWIDKHLKFGDHIDYVCNKLSSGIFVLRNLAAFADSKVLLTAYYGMIFPHLSYAVAIWGSECFRTNFVFKLQKKAVRIVFNLPYRASCREIFKQKKILTFPCLYMFNCVTFVKKHPQMFRVDHKQSRYNLRPTNNVDIPSHKTSFFERHLRYRGAQLFNALPETLKADGDVGRFERGARSMFLEKAFYTVGDFLPTSPPVNSN